MTTEFAAQAEVGWGLYLEVERPKEIPTRASDIVSSIIRHDGACEGDVSGGAHSHPRRLTSTVQAAMAAGL